MNRDKLFKPGSKGCSLHHSGRIKWLSGINMGSQIRDWFHSLKIWSHRIAVLNLFKRKCSKSFLFCRKWLCQDKLWPPAAIKILQFLPFSGTCSTIYKSGSRNAVTWNDSKLDQGEERLSSQWTSFIACIKTSTLFIKGGLLGCWVAEMRAAQKGLFKGYSGNRARSDS